MAWEGGTGKQVVVGDGVGALRFRGDRATRGAGAGAWGMLPFGMNLPLRVFCIADQAA